MPDTTDHPSASEPNPLPQVPCTGRPFPRRPLPDAMAISAVTVPDPAPPFDDDAAGPALAGRGVRPPGPLPGAAMAGGPEVPVRSRGAPGQPGRQVPARLQSGPGSGPAGAGAGPGADGPLPAGHPWPSQFAQVLAETLAGGRPPRQLNPWTSEQARRKIAQLGPVLAAAQRPRVRRIVLCRPADGVLEMAIIVGLGPRVRALAVRLERTSSDQARPEATHRWCCTAVEAA